MNFGFDYFKEVCLFACLLFFFSHCSSEKNKEEQVEQTSSEIINTWLKEHLVVSVNALEKFEKSFSTEDYLLAREHFKKIESLISFADRESYLALNQPNILKIQEEDPTDVTVLAPFGFQVIEELLLEPTIDSTELLKQSKRTRNRLNLVERNTQLKLKNYHLLWIIRDQVVRIATLNITGFDSPIGNGLKESALSYAILNEILDLKQGEFQKRSLLKEWQQEINESIALLDADFDTFDRYSFIRDHTHHQLGLLNQIAKDWKVDFPLEMAFNNEMTNLFTDSTFNRAFFHDHYAESQYSEEKVALGKRLFNDPRLSKSNQMSCATCHRESLAFTDGLKVFPKQIRNTPTLLYASLQKSFFYDNRAGSLEGQIVGVVNNENEFHMDLKSFTERVLSDTSYKLALQQQYDKEPSDRQIRNAIATYIRSLTPFNSRFDKNMRGERNDLTSEEKMGFNLFMGKAQCGTCHFAPVFNGTVPPYFTQTEMELLGVPEDTINVIVDEDFGRYELLKTEQRKHFFKTPTVRNASTTAPYMHNGVYETLHQVMNFYNNGGGVGMGIELEYQTLPSDSLKLNTDEVNALIAFVKSLEDESSKNNTTLIQ